MFLGLLLPPDFWFWRSIRQRSKASVGLMVDGLLVSCLAVVLSVELVGWKEDLLIPTSRAWSFSLRGLFIWERTLLGTRFLRPANLSICEDAGHEWIWGVPLFSHVERLWIRRWSDDKKRASDEAAIDHQCRKSARVAEVIFGWMIRNPNET